MGIEDIANQAKDMVGGNADKVGEVIDQAAEKAKELAPDQVDGMVDQAAQAAKDAISGQ
jgi:ABC-type transporter Mla subunit MlaD